MSPHLNAALHHLSDPTLDVRLRDDAREVWWRVQTGQPLTPEERKNLSYALSDIETSLKADEVAQREAVQKEAA
jgi:hypothetical protein